MHQNLSAKILYVEDEFITRMEVKTILNSKYKNIFTAKDGKEGFELYQSIQPDIVITDIKMPVMDGIEMTKKIRQINTEVPVIVASAFEKEFFKFDDLNVFGYVTKPITRFNLLIMIEDALLENE